MLSLLVRIEDLTTHGTRQHSFAKSPVHLGRNELNELPLPEPFVSMWHAIIRFDDHSIEYVDLGSTNGTLVEGTRIPQGVPTAIKAGANVQIGSLKLHLSLGEASQEQLSTRTKTQFGMRAVQTEPARTSSGSAVQQLSMEPAPPVSAAQEGVREALAPEGPGLKARAGAGSIQDLFAAYVEYRKAYVKLHQDVTARITASPVEQRRTEVTRLIGRFPALKQEQPFIDLLRSLEIPLPPGMSVPASTAPVAPAPGPLPPTPSEWKRAPGLIAEAKGEPDAREAPITALLNEFVRCYLKEDRFIHSGSDAEKFLDRLAVVLEAFGRAFVELRKGQEQFGEEMSVRTISEPTALSRAEGAQEALAYLLDWRVDGETQAEELTRGFADVMIHQVAMLNGVKAGIRSLLQRLGPENIEKDLHQAPVRVGSVLVPGGMWPLRSFARWRRYVEMHRQFDEEEQALTSVVFGREFARAYAVVTGEGKSSAEEGADGTGPRPRRKAAR